MIEQYVEAALKAGWTTFEFIEGFFCFVHNCPSPDEAEIANVFDGDLIVLPYTSGDDSFPEPFFLSSYDQLNTLENWQLLCDHILADAQDL